MPAFTDSREVSVCLFIYLGEVSAHMPAFNELREMFVSLSLLILGSVCIPVHTYEEGVCIFVSTYLSGVCMPVFTDFKEVYAYLSLLI